jgi:6-phosphogluconolactonase
MTIEERAFDTMDAAAGALVRALEHALNAAIAARGRAVLMVSGGRTPRHVYPRLAQANVDWASVTMTLSDERWTSADQSDSNEGLVRAHLMQGAAAAAAFIPLYGGEATPEAGRSACEARLAALAMPFDAVYLGLGPDGHIASLFPGDPALDVRNRLCAAVPETQGRQARITLTPSAILNARQVFLLFDGAEKQAVYTAAKKPGPIRDLPVRLLLAQNRTPVSVFKAP